MFFRCCLFHFSKGKGRGRLLQQSPVFACNGPWAGGCGIHADFKSRCLPASQLPFLQEGVTTNLSLAKVLWLISKLSVMEGRRGGQRESQTREKVGDEDAGEDGPGRPTGLGAFSDGWCRRSTARHGMGNVSQVMEIRGSAALQCCGFGPCKGTSLLRASWPGCPAIQGVGTQKESPGLHRADLFW